MARGGFRPGAGRPRNRPPLSQPVVDVGDGLAPLQYMLKVVRDPNADPLRRDRMAVAAAPYCHPKISDQRVTKKEARAAAAKKATVNTEWEGLIAFPQRHDGQE
jgi:hypothetical protein